MYDHIISRMHLSKQLMVVAVVAVVAVVVVWDAA